MNKLLKQQLDALAQLLADSEGVMQTINEHIQDRDILFPNYSDDLGDEVQVWDIKIELYVPGYERDSEN